MEEQELLMSAGEFLKMELSCRKIKQIDFANAIGMSKSHFSELINGKISFTKSIAEKISKELGIPSVEFLQIQSNYKLAKYATESAEQEAQEMLKDIDKKVDLRTLCKRLTIDFKKPFSNIIDSFNNILGASPLDLTTQYAGMFKKSEKTGLDERMILTWVILAKHFSKNLEVQGIYDRNKILELVLSLRDVFHKNQEVISKTTKILSAYGIRFCVVNKVDRASIDGFSYIEDGIPTIVVTQRYDRIDNFAFSVMHELGHIYLNHCDNSMSRISIDLYEEELSKEEEKANEFALYALIDRSLWSKKPSSEINPFAIQTVFTKWANRNQLNPWIVLGCISKETGMYRFKGNDERHIN